MHRRTFIKSLFVIPLAYLTAKVIPEVPKSKFKVIGTSTGRLSSSKTNFREIEKSWGRRIPSYNMPIQSQFADIEARIVAYELRHNPNFLKEWFNA